ncbi:Succinoglycan biosynthesis protein [Candidatus Rhodobacter oscarellae]|uniref:Succinoglycan biosynthesis protein n=2 Tax=Candidatus Rhodobacter oscarellae TaxID=1675527 RepID=A0A0J9E540_9RHOB|nr:Succinoglycan biosynthesis protein [Candidatus Rhodobacter lobularis]
MRGEIHRINGIDAPEHGQKCGKWACGKAATDALAELLTGARVDCVIHGRDAYGRAISTCVVNGEDIGKLLVERGVAWAFLRFSDAYAQQQLDAKSRKLGIWSGDYQTAWDFRAERWSAAARADDAPEGCPIKGNISKNGRIYHAPWSPWYSRTRINTAKGERWFCNEAEARRAGWRAPYWR